MVDMKSCRLPMDGWDQIWLSKYLKVGGKKNQKSRSDPVALGMAKMKLSCSIKIKNWKVNPIALGR